MDLTKNGLDYALCRAFDRHFAGIILIFEVIRENQGVVMGFEIERKFLLKNANWRKLVNEKTLIRQGYLNSDAERTVRVRVRDRTAFLTIKGKTQNTTRQEFEYEIPIDDADSLLKLCEPPLIEKTRFIVKYQGKTWEIDEFEGENRGLTVAEIELSSEDESFDLPDWIGKEVSHDRRYFNSSLIKKPFSSWGKRGCLK